jgi:hypothetical protein
VTRLRRKSAAKMKLVVLRQNEAGCPANATAPPNDINANKIVHPSIFVLLGRFPFSLTSPDGFAVEGEHKR